MDEPRLIIIWSRYLLYPWRLKSLSIDITRFDRTQTRLPYTISPVNKFMKNVI